LLGAIALPRYSVLELLLLRESSLTCIRLMANQVASIVEMWKADLRKSGHVRMADLLADPISHAHLFEGYESSLQAEKDNADLMLKMKEVDSDYYPAYKQTLETGIPYENSPDDGKGEVQENGLGTAEPGLDPRAELEEEDDEDEDYIPGEAEDVEDSPPGEEDDDEGLDEEDL